MNILEVKDLNMSYKTIDGNVDAVKDVSFTVKQGESFGLVGESGCGKTSVAMSLLQLQADNGKITSGEIIFDGQNIVNLSEAELREVRWSGISIVFQGAMNSWNPVVKIGEQIREAMREHYPNKTKDENTKKILELFEIVGLDGSIIDRYPHELSGGQRQRVGIARALSMEPKLIICDEPVSALDVSVQAQIINLLEDLQRELGIAYLFIAHDLAVVKHISHKVIVMYLGKIMEFGEGDDLYSNPRHPYTKALMDAAPIPDPKIERNRKKIVLKGELPSPLNPPSGCVFSSRCNFVSDACKVETPILQDCGAEHKAACIRLDELENA